MDNPNLRRDSYAVAIASVVLFALIPGAHAEELPGVDREAVDRTGTRPAGEPIAEAPQTDADGFVRIGDWNVKISGSLTVDVGTFAPRTDR
jgi:hypothetical protein